MKWRVATVVGAFFGGQTHFSTMSSGDIIPGPFWRVRIVAKTTLALTENGNIRGYRGCHSIEVSSAEMALKIACDIALEQLKIKDGKRISEIEIQIENIGETVEP